MKNNLDTFISLFQGTKIQLFQVGVDDDTVFLKFFHDNITQPFRYNILQNQYSVISS